MSDRRVAPCRVLVVGGTGAFGRRLVDRLLRTTPFDVVVAGRDRSRFVAPSGADALTAARVSFVALDVRSVTSDAIRQTGAFAVVDAAGPFQDGDLRLARAAIAAGVHYVDLADARDFVLRFGSLDAGAHDAGLVALTGASSTPALSNAALDKLTEGWRRVDRVEIAISPGNRAQRGLSVVRAILSYAGRPVRVLEGGRWRDRPGWGLTVRRRMPGIGARWLSLVDTPDLQLVPARHAVRDTVLFRAGLELSVLHLGLAAAALVVRAGLLRSLAPLAEPFRWAAGVLERFGTDRGGMLVEAHGLDASGHSASGRWWLVAEAGDGPFVPTLPALAVLRALASGRIALGARPCVGVLALEQIEAEFDGLRITSGVDASRSPACLYAAVLKQDFDLLPAPLRRLHEPAGRTCHRGVAEVLGPETSVGRIVAAIFGFPGAAEALPVSVEIVPSTGRERWLRDFGGRRFASTLMRSSRPGHVVERFGAFSFERQLQVGREGVRSVAVDSWRFGPCLLPRALAPRSASTERVDEHGRFCFDVELRLPFGLGRLVRYRGWLVEEAEAEPLPAAPPPGEARRPLHTSSCSVTP